MGPAGLSSAYLALGDRERALENLEEALRQRSHWLTFLDIDPAFDALRGNPRFEAVARRIGPKSPSS